MWDPIDARDRREAPQVPKDHRRSAGSRGKRRVKDVHELAFAGNHEVSANTPDLSRLARASGLLARLTVEQFGISCHNVISVLCFYSADIGLVSPCDGSIGPAGPNRMQERVEEETEVIKLRPTVPREGRADASVPGDRRKRRAREERRGSRWRDPRLRGGGHCC